MHTVQSHCESVVVYYCSNCQTHCIPWTEKFVDEQSLALCLPTPILLHLCPYGPLGEQERRWNHPSHSFFALLPAHREVRTVRVLEQYQEWISSPGTPQLPMDLRKSIQELGIILGACPPAPFIPVHVPWDMMRFVLSCTVCRDVWCISEGLKG